MVSIKKFGEFPQQKGRCERYKGFLLEKMGPSRHIMRVKEKSKVARFRDSSLQQGAKL